MTNKEAIETINANYPDERYTMLREALNIAIEALKAQEPMEPQRQIEQPVDTAPLEPFAEFIETYCLFCGTQHCEGPYSEWFEGCSYKDKLSKPSDYLAKVIRCKDCQM